MSFRKAEPLELTCVIAGNELDNGRHLSSDFYRVTARQPLWERIGIQAAAAGLRLERSLRAEPEEKTTSYQMVTAPNLPLTSRYDAWLKGPINEQTEPTELDEFILNARIQTRPDVSISFVRSPMGPNLLLAHRSVAYGRFLKSAIQEIASVRHADIVHTGENAPGFMTAYAEGTLLGATLHPSSNSFEATENAIRHLAQL